MEIYLPIKQVSEIYGIPKRTIYYRIHKNHYRINGNYEVNTADVEKIIENPIKKGRKWKNKI